MTDLGAAHKMRHSSISNATNRRLPKPVIRFLCVTVFTILVSLSATHALNDHHFDDMKFAKTTERLSLVLPHDTYPGYNIQRISSATTVSNATTKPHPSASYTLDKKYAKYFTVLENGMLMTTSDISPLVNKPVHLMVVEETPNTTIMHQLQIFIMDRKDMLHFPTASMDLIGEVFENQKAGTRVQGVPILQAYSLSGNRAITYSIVDGNEDGAFTFKNSKTHKMHDTLSIDHGKNVGALLVTKKKLDRESKSRYLLTIQATDDAGLDKAISKVAINILDENDNRPIFTSPHFKFAIVGNKSHNLEENATVTWQRFNSIGRVEATDAMVTKLPTNC